MEVAKTIKTMRDIVIENSDIIIALNQAISDFNERLAEHKEYFCKEINKLEQRLANLEFKLDMFIAITIVMFAMIWYQIFCLDAKIDRLDAKFDRLDAKFDAKFDNLQHLLIQILLNKNLTGN